jgi:hypothetical protein
LLLLLPLLAPQTIPAALLLPPPLLLTSVLIRLHNLIPDACLAREAAKQCSLAILC